MTSFIAENPIFSILLTLFLIEQIAIYTPGSFPYKYGIPITSRSFPVKKSYPQVNSFIGFPGIIIKKNKSNDLFLHYKYPFLAMGPLFFVGHVKQKQMEKLLIRLAPISTIFLTSLMLSPIVEGEGFDIINPLILVLWGILVYRRFINNYNKTINKLK